MLIHRNQVLGVFALLPPGATLDIYVINLRINVDYQFTWKLVRESVRKKCRVRKKNAINLLSMKDAPAFMVAKMVINVNILRQATKNVRYCAYEFNIMRYAASTLAAANRGKIKFPRMTTSLFFILQKPDLFDESCVTSIGCLNGYACDQTTKKCRLPNWNEACVENCADGFACHGGKCDIPISGDKCTSGIKADYYDCQPQAGWCISGDYKRSGFVSDLSYETTDMNHGNVYCFGSDSQMSVNVRAVFTGYIKFPYSGTWTIYSVVDDASRIYMDGNLTLSGQAGTQGTFTYNPGQNVLAKLTVQAVNFGGGCVFQLEWSHANQQRQVIPASAYVSGCSKSNLICDSASNICRKPDVNEACVDAIGCQEDSFCKNNTCVRKPGFNEDCEEMGCKNGLLCLPTEKYIGCFNDEYPDLALPNVLGEGISKADCLNRCRSLGYAYAGRQWYEHCLCGGTNYSDTHYAKYGSSTDCQCDSDNIGAWVNCVYQLAPKTCKKPTLNGDCVRSVGCDDGYECDILLKKCYPFECVESIGCLDGLNCENKLCQVKLQTNFCPGAGLCLPFLSSVSQTLGFNSFRTKTYRDLV